MDTTLNTHTEKKLYGKRPLWQWIAVYIVIGTIIYGAIYLLFFNNGYSYNSGSYSSQQTQQQKPY